jgi:hypothetical protein
MHQKATLSSPQLRVAAIVSRIVASVAGGWAFTWGFVTLGIALLVAGGMGYHDAQTLMFLLAFLVYLVFFLWAFSEASLKRVWLVLAGGAAAMSGTAWWISQTLV